jgi:hypothetical protein
LFIAGTGVEQITQFSIAPPVQPLSHCRSLPTHEDVLTSQIAGRKFMATKKSAKKSSSKKRSSTKRSGSSRGKSSSKKKSSKKKSSGRRYSPKAGKEVATEMRHMRSGKHPVKNRKQAIAIGLSKARQKGEKVPAA